MGCCCFRSSLPPLQPEQPLDHRVYAENYTRQDRSTLWENLVKEGGSEIIRFNRVEDIRTYDPGTPDPSQIGVLILTELFLWWHSTPPTSSTSDAVSTHTKPSKRSRIRGGSSFVIGYDMIEEVGIVCFDAGGCAVRVLAREVYGEPIEVIFRVLEPAETLPAFTTTIPEEEEGGAEGSEAWHQTLAGALDRVLKAYNWAHYFLHCGLRQHYLFEHRGVDRPQLSLLPNEEVTQTFNEILNFGASQEDLVGSLIITNCRVVWALDRDRTTYNVSVPHRAHVPSLTDTQTFGLCLVLHIPQPFLCNPDHFGGMRLGFGAAGLKGPERKDRLESILAHIKEQQGKFMAQPKYGVADYMRNHRQYQVESNVRLLHARDKARLRTAIEGALKVHVEEAVVKKGRDALRALQAREAAREEMRKAIASKEPARLKAAIAAAEKVGLHDQAPGMLGADPKEQDEVEEARQELRVHAMARLAKLADSEDVENFAKGLEELADHGVPKQEWHHFKKRHSQLKIRQQCQTKLALATKARNKEQIAAAMQEAQECRVEDDCVVMEIARQTMSVLEAEETMAKTRAEVAEELSEAVQGEDQRRMLAAITAADAAGFTCSEVAFARERLRRLRARVGAGQELQEAAHSADMYRLRAALTTAKRAEVSEAEIASGREALRCLELQADVRRSIEAAVLAKDAELLRRCIDEGKKSGMNRQEALKTGETVRLRARDATSPISLGFATAFPTSPAKQAFGTHWTNS